MSLSSAPEGIQRWAASAGKLVMPSACAHPSVLHCLRAHFGDLSTAIWKGVQLILQQNSVKSYVPEVQGLSAVDFSWERIVGSDFFSCGGRRHTAAGLASLLQQWLGDGASPPIPSAAMGQSREQSLQGVNLIFCVGKLQYLLLLRTQTCGCPLQVSDAQTQQSHWG